MGNYGAEGNRILRQFGANLGALRNEISLSQEKLAEKAKLHRTYIGLAEAGKKEPGVLTLLILADALGVEIGRLVEGLPIPQTRKRRATREHAAGE
jgi:transcriptional regulator with XRE-family HTH domain